jgi:phospholipid/cholesterol/gamma-HCH transport system permease protein
MRPIVIRAAGADEIARAWGDLRRVDRQRKGTEVLLDVSALTEASAAFEAFVVALDRHASAREVTVKAIDPNGVIAPIRARYDFASYSGEAVDGAESEYGCFSSAAAAVGRYVCGLWQGFIDSAAFLGETAVWAVGMLRHPGRFRFRDSALAFERAGFDGLPITILIGFLLGLILAFESAASLQMFGVEVYVADLIAIGLFRELGPLVTAIILAGRSGSAFAAEIGTMKVDEELDALTTFGLPPVQFLVLPRVVAAMLAMPVLTICSELAGLVGGAIVLRLMDVPTVVFWSHVKSTSTIFMIVFGLGKAALFGLLVGLIGCSAGMRTRNTADGVGVAATNAVVGGIVAIAVTDGLLAVICYIFGV